MGSHFFFASHAKEPAPSVVDREIPPHLVTPVSESYLSRELDAIWGCSAVLPGETEIQEDEAELPTVEHSCPI
jgi:hypothetical protein